LPTPIEEDRITSLSEAPKHAQTETERLKRNKEIIVQLKGLITKANEKYTLPGWWHFITNREAFITASASFPNGEPIPTKTTLENWKFIDADGYIDKSISLQDTGDLMTSSISLYKDGIRTYGTGETRKKEKSLAAIGTSLLNELERNKDVIVLEVDEVVWQGMETLAFSYTYRHSPRDSNLELSLEEEQEAGVIGTTIGTAYTHYVSMEDGYFVGHELSYIYPDERVKLANRSIVTVYEHVDQPPPEILAYFE
jgi:hypothetical protein